jgi:hypothetical protein
MIERISRHRHAADAVVLSDVQHVHAERRFPNQRAVDDHEGNIGLGRHIDHGIQGLRLIGRQNEDAWLLREQGLTILKLLGGVAGAIRPNIIDAGAHRFELLAPLLHRVDEGGPPGIVHVAVREGDQIVLFGNQILGVRGKSRRPDHRQCARDAESRRAVKKAAAIWASSQIRVGHGLPPIAQRHD